MYGRVIRERVYGRVIRERRNRSLMTAETPCPYARSRAFDYTHASVGRRSLSLTKFERQTARVERAGSQRALSPSNFQNFRRAGWDLARSLACV